MAHWEPKGQSDRGNERCLNVGTILCLLDFDKKGQRGRGAKGQSFVVSLRDGVLFLDTDLR